jgi:hypothetical protein
VRCREFHGEGFRKRAAGMKSLRSISRWGTSGWGGAEAVVDTIWWGAGLELLLTEMKDNARLSQGQCGPAALYADGLSNQPPTKKATSGIRRSRLYSSHLRRGVPGGATADHLIEPR